MTERSPLRVVGIVLLAVGGFAFALSGLFFAAVLVGLARMDQGTVDADDQAVLAAVAVGGGGLLVGAGLAFLAVRLWRATA